MRVCVCVCVCVCRKLSSLLAHAHCSLTSPPPCPQHPPTSHTHLPWRMLCRWTQGFTNPKLEAIYFRRRCQASHKWQAVFVAGVTLVIGTLWWVDASVLLSLPQLRPATSIVISSWGCMLAGSLYLSITYYLLEARGRRQRGAQRSTAGTDWFWVRSSRDERPSTICCWLQLLVTWLTGAALLCMIGFSVIATLSNPTGESLAPLMAVSYFPHAGGFALAQSTWAYYLFWTLMIAGFRLPLGAGALLLALSVCMRVMKDLDPLEKRNQIGEFWVLEHCSPFWQIAGTSHSTLGVQLTVGGLMLYNIWLAERLDRQSLGVWASCLCICVALRPARMRARSRPTSTLQSDSEEINQHG